MKNANTSVNESFVVDFFKQKIKGLNLSFIHIAVIAFLISQSLYSKNYLKIDTMESKGDLLEANDSINKERNNANELHKIAQYPGGLDKFYSIIINNFEDLDINHEGFNTINVSFSIEKDGSISDIKVNNEGMSDTMKKNIVSALKIKTKWLPATMNNEPVKTGYDLPIVFN